VNDLPDSVLELVFLYLDLRTLANVSAVCRRWNRVLNDDEDNDVWRAVCQSRVPAIVPCPGVGFAGEGDDPGLEELLSVCPTAKARWVRDP
jgi:hypothetical protein